jgi:cysteinyl-tRNA synthetase
MPIKIYNTLTRKKEEFQTLEPGKVRMYVCGPTVYSNAHVGHAMSALVFDIIRRYLEYRGYQVKYAMNFTDVDDKIIKRANDTGVDPFALAEKYIAEYKKNLNDLNVLPATINPRATNEIAQIIQMVQDLIDNGYAYPVDGDVYFRVRRDPDYGKLSGRSLDGEQAGSRIDVDDRKEHPMDFALWKNAKPGEPAWESPWGKGRPGWHIECSAMNLHHLGEQIDIHGGGNDLIFPHHENEIAQTESLTHKPFATYWMHNGMLQLAGEKMSKSLGNLVSIDDFLAKHDADALRLLILTGAYRSPLNFNEDAIVQAERGVERLASALRPALPGAKGAPAASLAGIEPQLAASQTSFEEAMDDDFNSAGALAALFELVRLANQARADGASDTQLQPIQAQLRKLAGVLGLRLEPKQVDNQGAAPFIELLIELRRDLRTQKQYALADQVRQKLAAAGVVLEDSKEGTTWHWGN